MYKKVLIIVLIIFTSALSLKASEVSFTASAPDQVAQGERIRVTYTLNTRPDNFTPPPFGAFQIVAGPSQSSSSSTQIINNQVTTTVTISYTYVLQAAQIGEYSIDPASATIDGTLYKSNPLKIMVTDQTAPGGQSQPSTPSAQSSPSRAQEQDLFIRATVNNSNPYQGEQVIVSYRLFTRVPVNQYSIERLPSFQGFWSENLSGIDQGGTTTEVIDGISYRVAEIRRVALFPQRTGEITIEPLEVEALVRIPSQRRRDSFFDEFFGGSSFFDTYQNVKQTLRSNPVNLQVKALPGEKRPQGFNGFVGNLNISASLHPDELNVNDAANLTLNISGQGNLRMLEKPAINFPVNLEVFDPSISDNIRNTASGVSGSREMNFTLIPRTPGIFEIPAINLVYFDPSQGRYITKATESFTLEVAGGPMINDGANQYAAREQVRTVTSDIRFIVSSPFSLQPLGTMFYQSKLFYALIILPFLLFAGFMVYWRRQIVLQSNLALQRNRKAEKTSRKRLNQARTYLKANNSDAFYDEISRSLWGYISDKLSIPRADLSRERVHKVFLQKDVPDHLSQKFFTALDDCEYARFAPGSPKTLMDETYEKTMATIISLEKELRNKR